MEGTEEIWRSKTLNRLTYKVDGRLAADSDRLRDMRELAGKMANLLSELNQVVNFGDKEGANLFVNWLRLGTSDYSP